jgi:hypothetical protein
VRSALQSLARACIELAKQQWRDCVALTAHWWQELPVKALRSCMPRLTLVRRAAGEKVSAMNDPLCAKQKSCCVVPNLVVLCQTSIPALPATGDHLQRRGRVCVLCRQRRAASWQSFHEPLGNHSSATPLGKKRPPSHTVRVQSRNEVARLRKARLR